MDETKFIERLKTTGRNDVCPCGSGKKYKKCHLAADEAARSEENKQLAEQAEAAAVEEKDDDGASDSKKGIKSKPSKFNTVPKYRMNKGNKPSNIPRRTAK